MVYECDQCAAPLLPGVRACPKCGDAFEDEVPADAEVPARGFTAKPMSALAPIISPSAVSALPSLKSPQIGPLREMSKEAPDGFQEFTGPELVAHGKAENKSGKGIFQALLLIGAVPFVLWMMHLGDAASPSNPGTSAVSTDAPVAASSVAPAPVAVPTPPPPENGDASPTAPVRSEEEAMAPVRARLQHDYPDSYSTQKVLYDGEVEAYHYMLTVPENNVKRRLEQDYPDSYSTQKVLYEGEMKSKTELGQ